MDKKTEQKTSIAEMTMLRWMIELTRKDVGVASTVGKMGENKLRKFVRVMRRDETEAARIVLRR